MLYFPKKTPSRQCYPLEQTVDAILWQTLSYRYVKYSGLLRGDGILVAETAVLFSLRALNPEPAADVQTSGCLAAGLPFQGLLGLVFPFSNRLHGFPGQLGRYANSK